MAKRRGMQRAGETLLVSTSLAWGSTMEACICAGLTRQGGHGRMTILLPKAFEDSGLRFCRDYRDSA